MPAREALVHEQGSRYIDFLLPGILGLNLMGTGIWGIGFSIVNARLKKTLKLMVATPMRKSDYLLAQMLSRFVFLVVEVVVILAFGVLAFQRPDPRLARAARRSSRVLGALSFAGLGLLVAARARDARGRQRPDEPRDGADVAALGRLLLVGALPEGRAAVHPGAAADGPERRAAGGDAGGPRLAAVAGLARGPGRLGLVSFAVALKIFRWQ